MEQNLKEMEFEQLCELLEEGTIGWKEWLEAQEDNYEGYAEWLAAGGLDNTDENAFAFIGQAEKEGMENQMDNLQQSAYNGVMAARMINARIINS